MSIPSIYTPEEARKTNRYQIAGDSYNNSLCLYFNMVFSTIDVARM